MDEAEARAVLTAARHVRFHEGRTLADEPYWADIVWQTGPHAEGRNGIEVDEALDLIIDRMWTLERVLSSEENVRVIDLLTEAKGVLLERRRLRNQQKVRGTFQPHVSSVAG